MEKLSIGCDLTRILPTRFAPVAITNAAGKIIGTYVPKLTWDDVEPEGGWPTDEELAADLEAAKHGPRYTTDEVIAHLRSLG